MKHRGLGSVFREKYRDKKTRELRECSTWTIQYVAAGKTIRERSGTTDKSEAVRLLRQRVSYVTLGVAGHEEARKSGRADWDVRSAARQRVTCGRRPGDSAPA